MSLQLNAPKSVLCLGAHCDDIEIGCGGSLLRWQHEFPNTNFHWVVFAGEEQRAVETRQAAALLCGPAARLKLDILDFRASYFPSQFAALKDTFERIKSETQPDLILTHHLADRHQDHATLAELTWNTWRSCLILEYEIPKYEGDLGHPNFYVPISAATMQQKVTVLMDCFKSQQHRAWFTPDTFTSLARIRGVECAAPGRFAEAFHARKVRV
jgi:LmbE family N-acetylglucosaminyl deacetylase